MFLASTNTTLVDMARLCGVEPCFRNGCFTATCKLEKEHTGHSFRMDAFMFIMCETGNGNIVIDGTVYDFSDNRMAVILPGKVVSFPGSEGTVCHVVVITPDFIGDYCFFRKQLLQLLAAFRKKPLCLLIGDEQENMMRIFGCVRYNLEKAATSSMYKEAALSSLRMMLYTIMQRHEAMKNEESTEYSYRRTDELYEAFIKELMYNYKTERNVAFYASKLCITSKYLSTIVGEISGKTTKDIIKDVVIEELKRRLKYTGVSIKELAYEMNFPNISFFGKYFKSSTGMSPAEYRRAIVS